jgi:hypothetical protein
MASVLIDSLRARVTARDEHHCSVETLATLAPGDHEYDTLLISHATATDPTVAVRQALDVKVCCAPLRLCFP